MPCVYYITACHPCPKCWEGDTSQIAGGVLRVTTEKCFLEAEGQTTRTIRAQLHRHGTMSYTQTAVAPWSCKFIWSVFVDYIKMVGRKETSAPMLARLRKKIEVDEETIRTTTKMFQMSTTSNVEEASQKITIHNVQKVSSWSYDVKGSAEQCAENIVDRQRNLSQPQQVEALCLTTIT